MPDLDLQTVSTEDAKSIVARVEDYYRQAGAERLPMARAWEKSIRFVRGDHYLQYVPSQFRYDQLPVSIRRSDYVPRPITNYIYRYAQALISWQIAAKVNPTVQAASDRDEDRFAARTSEAILEILWQLLREDEKHIDLETWRVITGTAIKKVYWDASAGGYAVVPNPETGEEIMIPLGDVKTSVLSPFNFAVDPEASDIDSAQWVMEFSIQSVQWIKEQFAAERGEGYTGAAAEVHEDRNLNTLLQTLFRLSHSIYTGVAGQSVDASRIKNKAVVKEVYERPSRDYPQGRCFVVAGEKLLYSGPSPYFFDTWPEPVWHPYTFFRYMPDPGSLWGLSVIYQLTRPQQRMNAIDSMIVLNRKTNAAPKILLPNGSGVPNNYLVGRPGLGIPYNPVGANGAKPEVMQGASLPADVLAERNQAPADMDFIVGGGELLRGAKPPGASAFAALSFLNEQKENSLAVVARQYELGLQRSERMKLLLVQRGYQEPRPEFVARLRARLAGASSIELENFIGSDLRNNVEVRVEPLASIPRSRILQQQTLLELIGRNLLPSVLQDPQEHSEFLEIFNVKRFGRTTGKDVRKAEAENLMIRQGANVSLIEIHLKGIEDPMIRARAFLSADEFILPDENHELHIYVHTQDMKDVNYLKLPEQIRLIHQFHVEAHRFAQQQLLSAQQAQMMAMQAQTATGGMQMGSRGQAMTTEQMQQGMVNQEPSNGTYLGMGPR